MHNDELCECSREISIWHTKTLTGPNAVEKQRIDRGTRDRPTHVVYSFGYINVPTTVYHMRAHENGELARMAKSYFQPATSSNKLTGWDSFQWRSTRSFLHHLYIFTTQSFRIKFILLNSKNFVWKSFKKSKNVPFLRCKRNFSVIKGLIQRILHKWEY